jgi:hypothetical protein
MKVYRSPFISPQCNTKLNRRNLTRTRQGKKRRPDRDRFTADLSHTKPEPWGGIDQSSVTTKNSPNSPFIKFIA